MATTQEKIQWIINYFKFDLVVKNTETNTGITGNDYMDVSWYENEFGMLMIKIESIEINNNLIAHVCIPDTEFLFVILMKILKINYNG